MTPRKPGDPTDPPNAFDPHFLHHLTQHDEPDAGAEADTAGPWKEAPAGERGHAVLREAEELAQGDRPAATFGDRHLALLAAAVLPATGRPPTFHLSAELSSEGFPVTAEGKAVGHLRQYDPLLMAAVNLVDFLVRTPRSLALVLATAGSLALERTGRILAHLSALDSDARLAAGERDDFEI
jgi:hypothetical protein